jgi:hypothetical protein
MESIECWAEYSTDSKHSLTRTVVGPSTAAIYHDYIDKNVMYIWCQQIANLLILNQIEVLIQ